MDGSEIFSLLESARKPTEFIGGVTSSSQSWVQVAFCFHPWCSASAWLPCFFSLRLFAACVCMYVCVRACVASKWALPQTPQRCPQFSIVPAWRAYRMHLVPLQEHTSDTQKAMVIRNFNGVHFFKKPFYVTY